MTAGTERGCTYCGQRPASFIELGVYSCGSSECEREMAMDLRERDQQARESAAADDYARYR